MNQQLMLFEGHEVIVLFANDVGFKFEGDFIIGAKDLAISLEYQGESATSHVLKFCKDKHIYHVKNSDILNRNVRKLNNAGEKFISNLSLNRVLGQSGQPKAEPFQDWLYEDILPTVQKTGGYVANDDAFLETYLPFADAQTRIMFRTTLATVRQQNDLLKTQQLEIEHKETVIIGLVDDIDLATKRQILNRVVRKAGNKFQERWRELYKQFEMKYHLNLNDRLESYNKAHKPKLKSKVDYIDTVMGKIPELYEICCKLFENDVKDLINDLYSLNSH